MNPEDNIGLTDFLVIVYKFIKRNLIILGLSIVIGLLVGFGYASQKASYYSSEMIGFSNVIEKTTLLEILSPLTTLTDEKNYEELAVKLGISIEDASEIRVLTFANSKHTITSHAPSVTDKKLGELIVCYTEVYDRAVLPKLESGISNYLNNNTYVKSSETIQLQKTRNLIHEISTNIALIDSLNSLPNNSSSIYIQKEINPFNYKEALLEVENLKVEEQTLKTFTVVSSFYKVQKPSNKSLLITIAATLAFFVMGLIIVFIKELAQLAKE